MKGVVDEPGCISLRAAPPPLPKTQGAPTPWAQQREEARMREEQQPVRPPVSPAQPFPPHRPQPAGQHTLPLADTIPSHRGVELWIAGEAQEALWRGGGREERADELG